jgi:hypothetical protein
LYGDTAVSGSGRGKGLLPPVKVSVHALEREARPRNERTVESPGVINQILGEANAQPLEYMCQDALRVPME